MGSSSQVGFLVPLNDNEEEDSSIPRIQISKGINVLGRDVIPTIDKRLSRKHLSLTVSPTDPSAEIFVEGTNPVVITTHDQRKKLFSREKFTIRDGDIFELIPGHYLFKYTAFDNVRKRPLTEDVSLTQKRMRQLSEDEALATRLQIEMNDDLHDKESSVEAIRNFKPPKDKMPQTFRLMRVKGLQPWANTSSVSVGDVIQKCARCCSFQLYGRH